MIGEGSREREASLPDYAMRVREVEPLVSAQFVGGLLGPFVGDLVAGGSGTTGFRFGHPVL